MSTGPTPIYLFNGMATTGVSDVADCSAFTRKSSVQIFITGTATVQLQGTLDPNNEVTWMDTNAGYSGPDNFWVTIPENVTYIRAFVSSHSSGTVTVIASRGIADDNVSVVSAQNPVSSTTGAQ